MQLTLFVGGLAGMLVASALAFAQSSQPARPSSPAPSGGAPAAPAAPAKPGSPAPAAPKASDADEAWKTRSLYTIELKTLEGEPATLADMKGKVALVVNVASECGYTPQYEGLEKLYRELKDRGFVVLAFPCNEFGGQEAGTPKEIREFCTARYGVTFPMYEKCGVKAGDGQSTVYRALAAKTGSLPRWNFGKYVVSRDGVTATYFDSKVTPDAKELRDAIEKALAEPQP